MFSEEFNRRNVETGQLEENLTALYVRVSLNPEQNLSIWIGKGKI